jgi:hypothetical protein
MLRILYLNRSSEPVQLGKGVHGDVRLRTSMAVATLQLNLQGCHNIPTLRAALPFLPYLANFQWP